MQRCEIIRGDAIGALRLYFYLTFAESQAGDDIPGSGIKGRAGKMRAVGEGLRRSFGGASARVRVFNLNLHCRKDGNRLTGGTGRNGLWGDGKVRGTMA